MLIDLHLHTQHSDGVWPADRLFEEVRARNLEAFCVSDHDCLGAYPVPTDLQPRLIPGLEVDTHFDGHTTHLLAYGVRDVSSPLLEVLRAQRAAREERMHAMIARLETLGISITIEEVAAQAAQSSSYGRPHLARALVARGHVSTVQEAFDLYLADEGTGYVALERLDAGRAVDLIRESGGVTIVAHPMRLRKPSHLDELVALGVNGVETVHPTADEATTEQLFAYCRERGLLATGGTDFHAPVEGRPIGIEFPAQAIDALRSAIEAVRTAA